MLRLSCSLVGIRCVSKSFMDAVKFIHSVYVFSVAYTFFDKFNYRIFYGSRYKITAPLKLCFFPKRNLRCYANIYTYLVPNYLIHIYFLRRMFSVINAFALILQRKLSNNTLRHYNHIYLLKRILCILKYRNISCVAKKDNKINKLRLSSNLDKEIEESEHFYEMT